MLFELSITEGILRILISEGVRTLIQLTSE